MSRNFAENFFERLGVVVKIYEDEIAPSVEAQRKHAHGAAIEKFDALDVGRADEFSFEGVSPAMVLAAHDVLAAAAERDGTSTVAADVAEGAQSSLLVTNNQNWFTCDFGGEISFGIGDGFLRAIHFPAGLHCGADELPYAAKDFFLLDFEDSRIGVKARGQCVGALDLLVHVEVEWFAVHGQVL